ncbi:tRNA pseudouridine(13) synthase TruD [Candidatus Igneacidithiobacillus taiwanensis]|uniref:tRNA pseudouridine(13) synthase TruD n=1 Tax=Candidatus Igneacidithiobacillus taiwanensis TaxID=1945924 RepID=UPI00289810BF|nr:tRNA pseudouridine(13) synthase TruD [Candidatus Igneacidithiobacillus taiwanensis]MCE5360154.1 tRNA pseudouridine(13) synthase TruD [Acidithiobacillus sp.]
MTPDPLARRYPQLPLLVAAFRSSPETFFVEEILPFAADGEGDHAWLWLEKVGRNTEDVVRALARFAGVASHDIGYAGLKDLHARTRQAFTVPLAGRQEPDWSQFQVPGMQLLEVSRHRRKLRRGAHRGNRFVVVVETPVAATIWEDRLGMLAAQGFPNYFGAQRFGRDNLPAAGKMLAAEHRGRIPHHLRALFWSSARAALFNLVLAERVRRGSWDRILPGEILQLAGSHSHFLASPEEWPQLQERLRAWDLHPTGPLPGRGGTLPLEEVATLEREVLAAWPGTDGSPGNGTAWAEALARQGLEAARRALRCRPEHGSVRQVDDGRVEFAFSLPSGAYATVLLEAIGVVPPAESACFG